MNRPDGTERERNVKVWQSVWQRVREALGLPRNPLKRLEASTGIEPVCTDLQSAA